MTDWSNIVAKHGGIVWKTVCRIVDDVHDASDCFQEVFVDALKFSRKQPVTNWPGFLKRLATARSLDLLRSRMRSMTEPLTSNAEIALSGPFQPAALIAERKELFDQLRIALATMPRDQAEVCCLRYLETMSYEQISEQTGITVSHVGVLLHRAKSLLQVQLAQFDPAAFDKTETES